MARGRKPEANAQRRGGHSPEPPAVELVASPVQALAKPVTVAVNPTMSACWDDLVGSAPGLDARDVPLIEAYCYWYAVFLRAVEGTMTLDGRVATTVAAERDDGTPDPATAKPNPDLRTAEKATNMLRQLSDALNISPTARIRAGLVQAMTASTVAGLVESTDEGFRQFRESIARGELPSAT